MRSRKENNINESKKEKRRDRNRIKTDKQNVERLRETEKDGDNIMQ